MTSAVLKLCCCGTTGEQPWPDGPECDVSPYTQTLPVLDPQTDPPVNSITLPTFNLVGIPLYTYSRAWNATANMTRTRHVTHQYNPGYQPYRTYDSHRWFVRPDASWPFDPNNPQWENYRPWALENEDGSRVVYSDNPQLTWDFPGMKDHWGPAGEYLPYSDVVLKSLVYMSWLAGTHFLGGSTHWWNPDTQRIEYLDSLMAISGLWYGTDYVSGSLETRELDYPGYGYNVYLDARFMTGPPILFPTVFEDYRGFLMNTYNWDNYDWRGKGTSTSEGKVVVCPTDLVDPLDGPWFEVQHPWEPTYTSYNDGRTYPLYPDEGSDWYPYGAYRLIYEEVIETGNPYGLG